MQDAPSIGAKSLAVFGDLDMHGTDVQKGWTKLAVTADIGSTEIELVDELPWAVGSTIVITATGYEPNETEYHEIQSVDGKKIQLSSPLK